MGTSLKDSINIAMEELSKSVEVLCQLGRIKEARQIISVGQQLLLIEEIDKQTVVNFLLAASAALVKCYFITNTGDKDMILTINRGLLEAEDLGDKRAIADFKSLLGQASYYMIVNNASSLTSSESCYDKALSYQEDALKLRRDLEDKRGICESLFYIGVIHERNRAFHIAEAHYIKVQELAELCNSTFEKCEATRHLAGLAWYKGELDRALNYAKEALALRMEIEYKLYLTFDHILLGQIYLKMGNLDKALDAYHEAKEISSEMDQKQALMFALQGIGDILVAQKNTGKAAESYRATLNLAEELNIPRAAAKARECLNDLS